MARRRGLVGHTIVGGVSTGLGIVLTLATTPVLLRRLGLDAYGIWVLATVLLVQGRGLASLLDLGLQQSSIERIASADDDREAAERFGASLSALVVIGVLAALAVAAFASPLADLVGIRGADRADAELAIRLVAAQIVVDQIVVAVCSMLEGRREYLRRRAVDLVRAVVFCGAAVVATATRPLPSTVAAASLGAALAAAAAAGLLGVGVGVPPRRGGSVRVELGHGLPLMALRATGVAFRQGDKVVLGLLVSAAAVGAFDVAEKLNLLPLTVLGVATSALIPATAEMLRRRSGAVGDVCVDVTAWCGLLVLPMVGLVFGLAGPLTTVVAGQPLPAAVDAVRWLSVTSAVAVVYSAAFEMAIGARGARSIVPVAVVEAVLNLGLTLALVPRYGVAGAAAATAITTVVVAPALLHRIGVSLSVSPRLLARAVLPGAAVGLGAVVTTWVAVGGSDEGALVRGAAAGIVAVAGGAGMVYLFRGALKFPPLSRLEAV